MSSEYVLAVDSSTSVGWVTLARVVDGIRVEILSEVSIAAYSHAEALLPAIHTVLQENGLSPSALRTLVLGDGPGSFTGLRIGASVVSGLAFGISGKVMGVASHAGIACAYVASALLLKASSFSSAPLTVRVFSDGGDTLISSTFRIFSESTRLRCCELLELMQKVDPGSVVCSPDTVMIGTEGVWKGRVPIPGIREMVRPDIPVPLQKGLKNEERATPLSGQSAGGTNTLPFQQNESSDSSNWNGHTLPISSGLILALYAVDDVRSVTERQLHFRSRGFVTDATSGCDIRYGQAVKAMTLLQRRGW
jgi:hypothetical protein